MRGWALAVVLVASWMAAVTDARAGATQESLFQDDDLLLHAPPHEVDRTLDELRALGVDRLRVSVIWRNLAPRERPSGDMGDPRLYPAEQFDPLDHLVRAARRRGLEVLFNVRGGAPAWALGRRPPARLAGRDAFKPDVAQFGRFVAMLGRRYDGTYRDENQGGAELPRVSAWSIWNEPNWSGHLQPQSERVGRGRRSRLQTVAPRWYRALYRAASGALEQTGHRDDVLLVGETAPIGSAKLGELAHLRPLRFLRDLLCLDGHDRPLAGVRAKRLGCDFDRRGPLRASGLAHHPYSVTQAPDQPSRDDEAVMLADAQRLKAVLDAAAAAGRLPAGLPLWYTEFGYQTSPPDPFRGVAPETQAAWLAQAEQLTWADPRVAALTQFLLRDDEPREGYAPDDPRRWITYQTGLRYQDGRPKPAYETYRLPLVASADALWGLVRPGRNGEPQRIRIQHRRSDSAEWETVAERTVEDPRGYFTEPLPAGRGGWYRIEWVHGADRSLLGGFGPPPESTTSPPVLAGP